MSSPLFFYDAHIWFESEFTPYDLPDTTPQPKSLLMGVSTWSQTCNHVLTTSPWGNISVNKLLD